MPDEPHSLLSVHKTQPEPPKSKFQRRLAIALSITACLSLYVALAGPMSALHKNVKFRPLQSAIEMVFAPIVWFAERRVEPFSSWLKAYISLFR